MSTVNSRETHIKKREVKQINHYYPFGLTMNGAVNAADPTAYQLNQMKNNLKYTCPPLKCRLIDLDVSFAYQVTDGYTECIGYFDH